MSFFAANTFHLKLLPLVVCLLLAPSGSQDIAEVFDPNSEEVSFQRKLVINVANKAEDCYFIPDVQANQIVNFHFVVVNAGKSGQQMDISVRIRGPGGSLVSFLARKVEGQLIGHQAQKAGDFEVCFINRYSLFESKRVFWQFEVEGAFDSQKVFRKAVNETVNQFIENSQNIQTVIRKVRNSISKARHQQWWMSTVSKKHESRLKALQGMIDRWSMGQGFFVVVVGIFQVYFLRKFFNAKPTPHRIAART